MAVRLIGIGGVGRSGKDTLSEVFVGKGYFCVSLGDIVRNISRVRHSNDPNPISRDNMTETSNYLRQTRGTDFAIKDALTLFEKASRIREYKGLVLLSVRAPIEVDFILKNNGVLIWIEVTDEIRYQRAMTHLRPGESKLTFEQFMDQETRAYSPQPDIPKEIQMDLEYVKSHATKKFENNGNDMNDFIVKANQLADELSK